MRERLTVAFLALTVALCLLFFLAWTQSVAGELRRDESEETHDAAATIAAAVQLRSDAHEPVDARFLERLVGEDRQVVVHWRTPSRADVVARGGSFRGAADPSTSDDIWAAAEVDGGYVVVSQAGGDVARMLVPRGGLLAFLVLLGVVAGALVYLMARAVSQPFRRLAVAARQLGRGRFELDLPRTRIPEARAIGEALRTSARQVEERIAREQAFAERASHVLRTPLTSLRLELDDLAMHDDLPGDVGAALERCVRRLDTLDEVAAELVRLARTPSLVAGAELPLREIAEQCSRRWAEELGRHDRTLTVTVDGDLDATYTPGPVEHLHDLLLADVLHRSRGAVRLTHETAEGGALRLGVAAGEPVLARGRRREPSATFARAQAVVAALGGRFEGEDLDAGLAIVLPRR